MNDQDQIKETSEAIGYNKGYGKGFKRGFDLGEFVGASKANNSWLKEHQKLLQFLKRIYPSQPETKLEKEIEEIIRRSDG